MNRSFPLLLLVFLLACLGEGERSRRTREALEAWAGLVQAYRARRGTSPPASAEARRWGPYRIAPVDRDFRRLLGGDPGVPPLLDGWGRPIYYGTDSRQGHWMVVSPGADGRLDGSEPPRWIEAGPGSGSDWVVIDGVWVRWPPGTEVLRR